MTRLSRSSQVATARESVGRRLRLVLALAFAWGALVLANYYLQLWQTLLQGDLKRPRFYGDPSLPYIGEAFYRTILGVTSASILVMSAVMLGLFLTRSLCWRFASYREAVPVVASLGIGCFAYTGLALTAVERYQVGILRLVAAVPLIAGLLWWLGAGAEWPRLPALRSQSSSRSRRLWVGPTALGISSAFLAALAPEREYDALWYHLAYPQRYLQQGRLVDLPTDYVSLYPMTWELWFGFGLALGGQTAATLLHFACLPLTALLTYELTRRFVPGASAWLAVALFATVPTVIWEASTAYVDLALGLHVTLVMYSLLRFLQGKQRQWLMIAAFNLGMALATKHLALVVLGLASTGLVIGLWQTERRVLAALRPALALVSLSLIVPLPWYVRSWMASGNPVFPELYSIFGAPPQRWDTVTAQGLQRFLDQFGPQAPVLNPLTLPWHMTMHAERYHGTLGPLFLWLLPLLALRRWHGALPWLAAFVVGFVVVWASPLASFQMRFLVPISPLLAVLSAAAFGRLAAITRYVASSAGTTILSCMTALLLILNLPPFTALHERDRIGDQGWINSTLHGLPISVVIGAESKEQYLTRTVSSYGVWSFANKTLPSNARVLTWSGGDEFYTKHERVWANATALRTVAWATPAQAQSALQGLWQLGITHLIVDQRPPGAGDDWNYFALTSPEARAHWYEQLYTDRFYTLYRVRWEELTPQIEGAQT